MNRVARRSITAIRTAVLIMVFAGAGRSDAADPPTPDLTGFWIGTFTSALDGRTGEASLHVDSQNHRRFRGQLIMDGLVFDILGTVITEPPTPDRGPADNLLMAGREADKQGARMAVAVRGTVDPPEPDSDPPTEISGDYLILFPGVSVTRVA